MAKKKADDVKAGLPGWMATYGDLVTLLLCFFVLLFAMSSVDVSKFQAAMSSFADQIDVLPGGVALTGEELITNGISQINEIAVILENRNPTIAETDDIGTDEAASEVDERTDLEKLEDAQKVAQDIADNVAAKFYADLAEEGLEVEVDILATPNYVVLTLRGETLFDLGEAMIKPESERIISVIANTYKEEFLQYNIMIEGHTDNLPINTFRYPSNWYLSAARSIAVGTYLIDNVGIPDGNISCVGEGEFKPKYTNDTTEGRAANRRVEIKVNLGGTEDFIEKETILNQNNGE